MVKNRKLVLDTETTGLDFINDKIIEIGIVELIDDVITKNNFQRYINPDRQITISAQKIHGLSNKFLNDKPRFAKIAEEFLDFIRDDPLIIHNSEFDKTFLNQELENCGFDKIENSIIDTMSIAKKQFPRQTISLDALCRKLNVINTRNNFHGALLDANLLSKVYLKLTTGKQDNFDLLLNQTNSLRNLKENHHLKEQFSKSRNGLMILSNKEKEDHINFVSKMDTPIWNKIRRSIV